ncbi:MAG: hypothetical protein ACRENE_00360 [Polyangiaceae bacterium]
MSQRDDKHDKQTDDVSGAALPAHPPGVPDDSGPEDPLTEPGDSPPGAAAAVAAAPPPPQVDELATACIRFVTARYGVDRATLDYRPETLSFVDQWVRDARRDMAAPLGGPGNAETLDLAQAAVGAYLGEVMRRWFGARWVADGDHATWRLCLSSVFCAFNPIGMAREALLLAPADGWGAHLELDPVDRRPIEARLAALPGAGDDEFFAPTTRFDVLCIVVDALRASQRARGLGDLAFHIADYAAALPAAR